jgi:hypothetical protein
MLQALWRTYRRGRDPVTCRRRRWRSDVWQLDVVASVVLVRRKLARAKADADEVEAERATDGLLADAGCAEGYGVVARARRRTSEVVARSRGVPGRRHGHDKVAEQDPRHGRNGCDVIRRAAWHTEGGQDSCYSTGRARRREGAE